MTAPQETSELAQDVAGQSFAPASGSPPVFYSDALVTIHHGGLKHDGKTSRMGDVWRQPAPGLAFNSRRRQHPNEKPMGVLQMLCEAAPDARVLLDPFCGSGTALCAAKRAGIKSIGIEIDERHCETAARRCASELAMGKAENDQAQARRTDGLSKPEIL
jgi:hypothetical protein